MFLCSIMKEKREENPYHYPKVVSKKVYEDIILAAQELFREVGFDKLTIIQICQKAKISRVTFYKEFEDKEHLIFSLFLEEDKEFSKIMLKRMQKKDKDGKVPFRKLIADMLDMLGKSQYSNVSLPDSKKLQKRIYDYYANYPKDNWRYKLFTLGIEEGFIRSNIDMNFVLLFLKNLYLLYIDLSRSNDLPHGVANQMVIEAFFYGVSEYDKNKLESEKIFPFDKKETIL